MARVLGLGFWVLGLGVVADGCQNWHVPNPNDPADVGPLSPDVLRKNLDSVTRNLFERVAKREITNDEYKKLVVKAANEMLSEVDAKNIAPDKAWEYAEILQDAHPWAQADPVLREAVKYAKSIHNDDRWVNDSLRLAAVLAEENKVAEAIATARSVFGVPPEETAPILYGVNFNLVPAARGKGHDIELAHLLEDAIPIHLRTKVDPTSDAGKSFLLARPAIVARAWHSVSELYESAGKQDLADAALKKAEAALPAMSESQRR